MIRVDQICSEQHHDNMVMTAATGSVKLLVATLFCI